MKFTSFLSSFFFIVIVTQSIFCAEEEDTKSSSFAGISIGISEPRVRLSATETLKQYMSEVTKVNPESIQQAGYLLLAKFPEFSESDFEVFLTTQGVLGYLQNLDEPTPKLSSSHKKILIALSLFHGWGQPKDPFKAFELLESVKDLLDPPPGLARYLLWSFFKQTGHLAGVRNTTKILRLDSQVLVDLLKSSQTGFPPARRDHLEVAEHSGLLFNNALPIQTIIQFVHAIPTLPSPILKPCEKKEKDWRYTTERLTRKTAQHFYFPTAMATLLASSGPLPVVHELTIEKEGLQLNLIGFSSPLQLQDVISHVEALTRIHQLDASNRGEKYFVNLTTLRNDPWLNQFRIPMETPLAIETAVRTLPYQISTLKGTFRQLFNETLKIEAFFKKHFEDVPFVLEKIHGIARLERLMSKLLDMELAFQQRVVDMLLNTEPFYHALLEAEWFILKNRKVFTARENFMVLLSMGLAQERTRTALSFAHRPDHKKNHIEEWYYEKLLNHLFSLLDDRTSLTSSELANLCMKPLHAFLAFLHGDGTSPVWVDPKTYIHKAYEIIKLKPNLLVSWLQKDMNAQMTGTLEDFVRDKPHLQQADLPTRLLEFVATPDKKEVRFDFVARMLLHLHILTDTPDYE